jgi:hypothetical protein
MSSDTPSMSAQGKRAPLNIFSARAQSFRHQCLESSCCCLSASELCVKLELLGVHWTLRQSGSHPTTPTMYLLPATLGTNIDLALGLLIAQNWPRLDLHIDEAWDFRRCGEAPLPTSGFASCSLLFSGSVTALMICRIIY